MKEITSVTNLLLMVSDNIRFLIRGEHWNCNAFLFLHGLRILAKLIYALADPNDICEDFSDLVPETVSAFALLFIDQSNMKVLSFLVK